MENKNKPLVVDLDGTLTKTDTLLELMVSFVGERWTRSGMVLSLLMKDRATMKNTLAEKATLDVSLLPMNDDVLALIEAARANKRPVVLATASDQKIAEAVAKQWGPFDAVFASTPGHNLKSHAKVEALVEKYGEKGFDYIGNDVADIAVIEAANEGFLVNPSGRLLRKAQATGTPVTSIDTGSAGASGILRALRPHQWAKNALIAIPALAAQVHFLDAWLAIVLAFGVFSLMASSVYLVNDVVDVHNDRAHPTKKHRPLAAGDMSLVTAVALAPVLGALSFAIALVAFGWVFSLVLALYAASTLAYSAVLKRVVLVDVFVLAGLYGIRLVAGAIAVSVPLSPWLIAFSLFAFLSLALTKRLVEITTNGGDANTLIRGRGYLPSDSMLLTVFGVVSGFMAGVILALYIEDPATQNLYSSPEILWAVVPLWLYWISRSWLLAHRGVLNEDPVLYALTDKASYLVGVALLATLLLAR